MSGPSGNLKALFHPPAGRNVSLDCLRGIAAYLVVVHHLHLPIIEALPIDLGKFGIMMFFIISGYIIPNSFSGASSRLDGAADFVVKRAFRLYPAYWASILLALASPMFVDGLPSAATIAANLTMIQMMLGQGNIVLVYWTLQFELIFYALCLALFMCGLLFRMRAIVTALALLMAAALALAIARATLERGFPVVLPLSLSGMFFGAVLRRIRDGSGGSAGGWAAGYAMAVSVIAFIAYRTHYGPADPTPWYAYSISYCAAIATFYLVMFRAPIESSLLFFAGAISYSVYLLHIICLAWIDRIAPGLTEQGVAGHSVRLFALLVATTVLATLFYLFVEHPSIRLGRGLARRLDFSRLSKAQRAN